MMSFVLYVFISLEDVMITTIISADKRPSYPRIPENALLSCTDIMLYQGTFTCKYITRLKLMAAVSAYHFHDLY